MREKSRCHLLNNRHGRYVMKYLIILLSIFSLSAHAGDWELTHGGSYNIDMGAEIAYSYDGVARDVSKFYKPTNKQFNVGGYYAFNKYNTLITFDYDNGYNSKKYTIDRSARIGVAHNEQITKDFSIQFTGNYKFGGNDKHIPCLDSHDRQYYCGDLTAWTDAERNSENEKDYNVGLTFRLDF